MMIVRDSKGCVVRDGDGAHFWDGPCAVCGERSHAVWRGVAGNKIHICVNCAIDKLPQLIANAVCAAYWGVQPCDYERIEKDITHRFWKTLARDLAQCGVDDRVTSTVCQCEAETVEETT
jgi:hypothetical protein